MLKASQTSSKCSFAAARRDLRQFEKKNRRAINNGFIMAKPFIKGFTLQKMRETKHGRKYKIYVGRNGRRLKRPRIHTASTWTETPAILTGALSKSLGFEMKYGMILTYGADTPYARRHELEYGRSYIGTTVKNRRVQSQIAMYIKSQQQVELKGRR